MTTNDAIERAAKALADLAGVEGWNWYTNEAGEAQFPGWDDLSDDDEYMGHEAEWPNHGRNHYRKQARAALAAMPAPDDNWLDELPAKAWLNVQCNEAGCVAVVQMPKRSGARYLSGTAPTRRAAIEDAVRKAKGQGDAS